MAVNDLGRVLRRRWLLAVIGLSLAVVSAGGIVLLGTPTYSYSSTVLLLPPKVATKAEPGTVDYTRGNPLFYLGALNQSRDILIGALTSQNAQADRAKRFPGTASTVTPDILGSGPVLVIKTEGPSEQSTLAAQTYVTSTLPSTLASLQKGLGVQESAMITASTITTDKSPVISRKKQIRTGILAAAVIGLGSLIGIALIDNFLSGRSPGAPGARARRRAALAEEDPEDLNDAVDEPLEAETKIEMPRPKKPAPAIPTVVTDTDDDPTTELAIQPAGARRAGSTPAGAASALSDETRDDLRPGASRTRASRRDQPHLIGGKDSTKRR